MSLDQQIVNRRILIIDDNTSIHDDFRKILAPPEDSNSLDQARAALFGEVPTLPSRVEYTLDFASQGREGFGLIQNAYQQGNPYAVAFVDMRMPPGWDGLETIEHIWYADPEIQIVICTAYSDHPWEDVSRRIGGTDQLLILMKPFNSIEVVQIANALTRKWNLAHAVQPAVGHKPSTAIPCTDALREVNRRLQDQIAHRPTNMTVGHPLNGVESALQQKEEILAIMSHEMLTPMDILLDKAMLLVNSPLSLEQRGYVTGLQQCAHDLLSLVKDMHGYMASGTTDVRTNTTSRPAMVPRRG